LEAQPPTQKFLCSVPLPKTPVLKPITGGCSPEKYIIYAEEASGGSLSAGDASLSSSPERVLVEDCVAEDGSDVVEDKSADGQPNTTPLLEEVISEGPLPAALPDSSTACDKDSGLPRQADPQISGIPQPTENVAGKWRDLFSNNRSSENCSKLIHFSGISNSKSCSLLEEDLDDHYAVWKTCLIGYVAGKYPGFKALNNIISSTWHCNATLTIHASGWLIYKFNNVDDKMAVLGGGPYLVYGRPLLLRPMPEFFDFSSAEMTRVPVWIKLPNLPLSCWSPRSLSKIASVLGKPLQSDRLTSSLSRLSYARVLVEVNLMDDLPPSFQFKLPNGDILTQSVEYETLPKFCKHCKVLNHTTAACPSMTSNHSSDAEHRTRSKPSKPNNAMGHKGSGQSAQQTIDPLQAEVEAVTGGWEVVKGKKSNSRHKETSMTAASQRVTKDKEVACSNKGKEVACPADVRERGDESLTHPSTSNEGRAGSTVVLIRTEEQSCEGTSAGCSVRTGEKVCNEATQKAAPPAPPVVVTRSSTRKSGGSGRRPPTSPAGK
jgi:hypothetical protein